MYNITVTEKARTHLNKIISETDDVCGFRLAVKGSGCSGLTHTFEPVENTNGDHEFYFDTFIIVVDDISMPIVNNTEIDFITEGLNTLIQFNNPNAENTCGCGTSFLVRQ